jgi:hypothetical protein
MTGTAGMRESRRAPLTTVLASPTMEWKSSQIVVNRTRRYDAAELVSPPFGAAKEFRSHG